MKPVDLVERALRNSSRQGDIILDAFGGSGTTIIACETSGRHARLIELLPRYCDVTIRRWQSFTGGVALHHESGRAYNDVAAEILGVAHPVSQ